MTKAEYAEYLLTPHWQELKRELFRLRGRKCSVCDNRRRVEVHHLTYRTPITDCTVDDLLPLCRYCHRCAHFDGEAIDLHARELVGNEARRAFVISAIRRANGLERFPAKIVRPPKYAPLAVKEAYRAMRRARRHRKWQEGKTKRKKAPKLTGSWSERKIIAKRDAFYDAMHKEAAFARKLQRLRDSGLSIRTV